MAAPLKYKIEIEAPNGIWREVRGADGAIMTFDSEAEARTRLLELYPVETRMERYGGVAVVESLVGEGTEVRLEMSLRPG